MTQLVQSWSDINSGSTNLKGLAEMRSLLKTAFSSLGAETTEIDLQNHEIINNQGELIQQQLGKALLIKKRPKAPLKIFLGVHMDTVFSFDHPFQKTRLLDQQTLIGPGVADAKGGLVILLKTLETFESSPFAHQLGWEVLINPDEEIGSPGSAPLLARMAASNDLGLLFEPSLPNGAIASSRKGSGNFTVIFRGRSAHVGRDYSNGRSAISALASFIVGCEEISQSHPHIILNIGEVNGGEAVNIVPDLAIARLNIRTLTAEDEALALKPLNKLIQSLQQREGISITLHGKFNRPPKPETHGMLTLFSLVKECAESLELELKWHSTGGSCDGNILSAEGLSNLDSMGACGGSIHTDNEYLMLDSLVERTRLITLFLMRLGSGETQWEKIDSGLA